MPAQAQPATIRFAIVIPTLNESCGIQATILSVRQGSSVEVEVIVVDGGSSDNTCELAAAAGATVISAAGGRGCQLNAGWRACRADWVVFLHGDTLLPASFDTLLRLAIHDQQRRSGRPAVWGCFWSISTDLRSRALNAFLSLLVRLRTVCLHRPYGDQALFVSRAGLENVGGFREWPFLEDLDLVLRLRRLARPAIVPASVTTSGRRWQKLGFWRTCAVNQLILLAWACGVSVHTLASWYRGKPRRKE